ncbi:transposase [Sphingobium sp.]|uniref:transposase n=1 Tax=Sphingobium sp. TaxID=1912891 RepID=UPI00391A25FC
MGRECPVTKFQARCDAKGRPLGLLLTPGRAHDIQGFGALFRTIADKIEALLADESYDADVIRENWHRAEVEADIPAKNNGANRCRMTGRNIKSATKHRCLITMKE